MKKIFTLALTALLATQIQGFARNQEHQMSVTPEQKMRLVSKYIENYYVDTVNMDKVSEAAIKGMLKILDPHSTYSNPEETKALNEPLHGNFSGIGITYNMLNDTLYVLNAVVGGPAEKVGITTGDRVIMANDTLIAGQKMTTRDIMGRLRGPKGTEVRLKVLRKGSPELIEFHLVRDNIPIFSVDAAYMINPKTGYIRITRFSETTAKEFAEAMKKLRKEGLKDLIIDLQSNGGGYLKPAVEIAEMFLNPRDMIVYTKGEHTQPYYYVAEKDAPYRDVRVAVMVDPATASASEILSGALQDNDRGVIVGRRTFGKGLVQRPFPFPDGSMVRLTVSRYYTPSGRCIQKPYDDGNEAYQDELNQRYLHGEYSHPDSIARSSSERYYTKGRRPVYGGGGITPDIFVPIDTTAYTKYYRELIAKGLINRFALTYSDDNSKNLKKAYKKENVFLEKFDVTDKIMKDFVAFAKAEGVEPDEAQLKLSESAIRTIIKAIIGRNLFTQDTYYKVANDLNPIYRRTLELLASPKEYTTILSGGN